MSIQYQHGFIIKKFSQPCDYATAYQQMRSITAQRKANKTQFVDEIWLLQHPAVYTLGFAAKPEHILNSHDIPVQKTDRGGQVTYHGIGQLIVYLLLDLPRLGLGVKQLVFIQEQAVIELLAQHNIQAHRRNNAAGVYVNQAKIAALGLRIRHGCSYHGLSLNININLQPFLNINPCGYPDLKVTQLKDLGITATETEIKQQLLSILLKLLATG